MTDKSSRTTARALAEAAEAIFDVVRGSLRHNALGRALAEAAEAIFDSDEDARNTMRLINSFVVSWERHKHEEQTAWLADEFKRYRNLWNSDKEIDSTAKSIIDSVEKVNKYRASLQTDLDDGKDTANWLAQKIKQGAEAAKEANVGLYAANIYNMAPPHTQDEWNKDNGIEIAKFIRDWALASTTVSCAFQGARILGNPGWYFQRGKENPPASEYRRKFFEGLITSTARVGARTAVSGAIVVAVKKGWMPQLTKTILNRPDRIVSIVSLAMDNAKVLFNLAKGELTAKEALSEMEYGITRAVGSLAAAGDGAAKVPILHHSAVLAWAILALGIDYLPRWHKSQGTVRVETVPGMLGARLNFIFVPDDAHSIDSNNAKHAIFVDWNNNVSEHYLGRIVKMDYPTGYEAIRNVRGVSITVPPDFFESEEGRLAIQLLSIGSESQRKVEVTVEIVEIPNFNIELVGLAFPAA